MATSVSSVTSHFPSAENGFTTTTSGSVASGATTVGLNSVAGYTNGEVVVFVIDPTDSNKKQTFTGIMDTVGSQVTDVVWTAGTNQTHDLGATVVDYATATHISMMSKGILVHADQDGTLKDGAVDNANVIADGIIDEDHFTSATAQGWYNLDDTPDTVTYNGNRSYDLVFNSNDLTDTVSNGMRVKLTRTVTAPTQCADLETSSSQYFNRASGSLSAGFANITSTFTAMGWVKLESYTQGGIISRIDANDGWGLRIQSDGTVRVDGRTTSAGQDYAISYQAIPLNKWVHVAAAFTISDSTNTKIYIDGVEVPSAFTNGADGAIGVPAVALEVGALAGSAFFDGKLAQVAVFSSALTGSTIRSYMSQGLSGSETNLLAAYSLNNAITDLTANGNNLSAQGGAAATSNDTPFSGGATGTTEYGIITANSFSTNTTLTVQVPEGYAIPTSGGVSSVYYSTQDVPYGFPRDKGKWSVQWLFGQSGTKSGPTATTWYSGASGNGEWSFVMPVGAWSVNSNILTMAILNSGTQTSMKSTISTSSSSESHPESTSYNIVYGATGAIRSGIKASVVFDRTVTAATTHYICIASGNTVSSIALRGDDTMCFVSMTPNYV